MKKSKYLNLHLITINKDLNKTNLNLEGEKECYLCRSMTSSVSVGGSLSVVREITTLKENERYHKIIGLKLYSYVVTRNLKTKVFIKSKRIIGLMLRKVYSNIIKACIRILKKKNG